MFSWIKDHPFEIHLIAFFLMVFPAAGLYLAAQTGSMGWIWILLGFVMMGNIIVLLVR